MNIPFSILERKKFINKSCYDYHQTLAKKYYNSSKKNKSQIQNKSEKYNKKKIYNWFFTLDIKDKLKICSIYNNWFNKIMDQLLTFNYFDNSIRFTPKEIYENFYKTMNNDFDDENFNYRTYLEEVVKADENEPEKYFSTFFFTKEYKGSLADLNKTQYIEKDFLNELRFFSLNEYNDILSLSEELLNNKSKLIQYFDTFSNCKIFSEKICVIKANPNINNIFNFSFPNWVRDIEKFGIPTLIIICFEISISIYYQIFLKEQSIPNFDIDSKIEDLYNMKLTMENYIAKEINKEQNKIISILDKNKIDIEISSETYDQIFVEHENITDFVYKSAYNRKQSSFYSDPIVKDENINNALKLLKKELRNNIPQFVNNITFIKSDIAFKIDNIVYNIIYQKISTLCSQRNLEELYMDINETPKIKKKKKKNKKNKEKKEETEFQKNKEEEKESVKTVNDNKIKNNLKKNEINNLEENEIHNINDNKFSINAEDNKNNSNITDDEEDEENQFFSNDYYNEIENSINIKNINTNEENIKECIEMKYLDEKGKEIVNEHGKEEDKNEKDLLEELLIDNKQEKKSNNNNNNRKKKKRKNKNRKKKDIQEENNIELKKEEEKEEAKEEEKNNNINNNSISTKAENNSNISINEIKDINTENSENKKEENKNRKKHKDFFLYPVEHKKAKIINNNSNHKNSCKKIVINNIDDNNLIINKESPKDNMSQTSATEKSEIIEKNEIVNVNQDININNKNLDFSENKESEIVVAGNKNEKTMNAIEKPNKIEHTHEYSKIQNINLNNSTINNYVIIDKFPSNKSLPLEYKDFQNNIFSQVLSQFNYSMPFHQFPNYYLYERNDLFNDLTEEILSHEENISNNSILLEKYRKEIYEKIKTFIENVLNKNNFVAKLVNYGSHETGLSIEFSDIDILIKFCKINNINNICINNQQNIEEILALIYNELNNEKEKFNILQINAIYTASVPVLKIKFSLENIIPNEIKNKIKENYVFNFEEDILQLNFDFTFQEVDNIDIDIKIPSLQIISFVKSSINIYKEIKPIILILKRFMKINKLNSSFHGGLSSYSLFLLLYSYIKYMFAPNNSIGHYLYGFFEFYSNFNFGIHYINPILDCPFMIMDELHESGMMLIDPITSLNVAKSTFRIDQIKSVLMKGMIIIRNIFFTSKGKDYIHNLNNKNIFLKELFKNRNGTMIVEKIFQQIQLQNQQVIGKWKNI